jgi:hypothetical protein
MALVLIAAAVAAAVGAIEPGLRAWYVADDGGHLAYIALLDHTWRFFLHPQFGRLVFRPLLLTLEFYEAKAFGVAPLALHVTDLITHGLNTALVFALTYLLFRRGNEKAPEPAVNKSREPSPLLPAFAAALVFAVHPLTILTANWFACRADLMGTFFALAALIVIAASPRPSPRSLLASALLALAAMLCKETYLPLFLMAFFTALVQSRKGPAQERLKCAAKAALPVFSATMIYLCWRLLVLKNVTGYADAPSSLSGFGEMAWYNLPRVVSRAGRDLLFHHMSREHLLFIPLAVSLSALLVIGGIGAARRRKAIALLGLALIFCALIPAWNLSYMLVKGEERLLYFAAFGLSLLAASLVAGPNIRALRAGGLAAVICAAALYGLYSRQMVEDWRAGAEENKKLARAVSGYIEPKGPTSPLRRIYVLGLGPEHYFLDMLVKMELSPAFFDREIMTADMPCFILMARDSVAKAPGQDVPESARPRREPQLTDPKLIIETVTPPDLLNAAVYDPAAAILKWDGSKLEDMTEELRSLFHRRLIFQQRAKIDPNTLPSFSFRETRMKFDWQLATGLEMQTPLDLGDPYTFTALTNDPYLTSPRLKFPALMATTLEFEMKLPRRAYLPPQEQDGCIMWEDSEHAGFGPERSICFPIKADGEIEQYHIALASNYYWATSGTITSLRLDPVSYASSFQLYRMEFLPP